MTAMLMAAAAGLAMPLEDIHIPDWKNSRPDHVTRDADDQAAYVTTLQNFKYFFTQSLNGSTFADAKFARCTKQSEISDVSE